MTEVFIAAVSTTKFEMNDQDLEFYRDEKMKEIQEVRAALEHLHLFSEIPKKERQLANHSLVWKNLLILSKILGYQSEFNLIDQLRIPESILTQQLWHLSDLFILRHYYPRTAIGSWETTSDKYFILMEGIIEKELIRSSISKFDGETFELGAAKMSSGSKFRKNNKKRFARTDQQIPICLNSKRSEGRIAQNIPGNFRSITDVEMFEVSSASWRRYVNDFKHLQEEYLMNFIRKKLDINLNFDGKDIKTDNEQPIEDSFYTIITYDRKTVLQFNQCDILLLYMGEMLVTTPLYKVEISRGCILNTAAYEFLIKSQREDEYKDTSGIAVAKSLSTIIKISIKKLQYYLREVKEEREPLIQLLKGLENNRRSKKEQEKYPSLLPTSESLGSFRQTKMIHKLKCGESPRDNGLRTITQSPKKISQRLLDSSPKLRSKDKVIGLKSIENIVQKTAKAAELKHIQYLKKAHLTEEPNTKPYYEQNSALPESIFKDCMRNIQTKNELLKQAVRVHRQKLKNDVQRPPNCDIRSQTPQKAKIMPIADASIYLKKRIKDIYVRTEGSEEMITFTTSSERPTATAFAKSPSRETVGTSLQLRQFSDKQLYSGFYKWFSGGLGVMKKLQTGKIRRIKLK